MSEVFEFEYNSLQEMLIVNYQENFSYNMCNEDDVYSVAIKLNEQQATIDEQKIIIEERDVANERLIRFLIEMGLEKEYIKWEFKRCIE